MELPIQATDMLLELESSSGPSLTKTRNVAQVVLPFFG